MSPRPPASTRRAALVAGSLVLGLAAVLATAGPVFARPNVVVIQTDDQPAGTVTKRVMPQTHRLLVRPGTKFTNYVVTTPLCCPSRASLLTGQYGHNNKVLRNRYGRLRDKANVLPNWLQRAGYRTSHIGKYMNEYPLGRGPGPGWDRWATTGNSHYYDYRMYFNHGSKHFGHKPQDHLGRVVGRRSANEVHDLSGKRPFYIQADFPAPHSAPEDPTGRCIGAPVPDPRDKGRFRDATLPPTPSFNEADVSDKPAFVADRELMGPGDQQHVRRNYRCMLASLRSVDRGVGEIVRALAREHELANTAILFVSDNGFLFGEHRIREGKHFPYEEATRVPLVVRVPQRMRRRAPGKVARVAANIDLAPTILNLAHARPCAGDGRCRSMDGLSLTRPLQGASLKPRDVLFEMNDPDPLGKGKPCTYAGLRTPDRLYVEYERAEQAGQRRPCEPTDAVELYDLEVDPFEVDNLFPAPPGSPDEALQIELAQRLDGLRRCAGVKGRDPRTGERPFCARR